MGSSFNRGSRPASSQEQHCKSPLSKALLGLLFELSEVTASQGHHDEQEPERAQARSITALYKLAEALPYIDVNTKIATFPKTSKQTWSS